MNKRQKAIVAAITAFTKGSRGIVQQFETVLDEYWNKDFRSVDNIQFFLNAMHSHPKMQEAMRKLTRLYIPVTIEGEGEGHELTNRECNEELKARCLAKLAELKSMELQSFLHHPQLRVTIEHEWNEKVKLKNFEKSAKDILEHGVSITALIDILEKAASGSAPKAEPAKAEEPKVDKQYAVGGSKTKRIAAEPKPEAV